MKYKRKFKYSAIRDKYGKVIAYVGIDKFQWTRVVVVRANKTWGLGWEYFSDRPYNVGGEVKLKDAIMRAEKESIY